jgi:hypothetical protein
LAGQDKKNQFAVAPKADKLGKSAVVVAVGLGRIVALHHRASTSDQIHEYIIGTSISEAAMRPDP